MAKLYQMADYQPTAQDLREMELSFLVSEAARIREEISANPAMYLRFKDLILETNFQISCALDAIEIAKGL